jgi:hypothetical protein
MTPIRCLLALTALLIATASVAQPARPAEANLVLVLQAPDRAFPLALVRGGTFVCRIQQCEPRATEDARARSHA